MGEDEMAAAVSMAADEKSASPILGVASAGMGLLKPVFRAESQLQAAAFNLGSYDTDEIREAIRQTQFYAEALKTAKAESLSKPAPTWRDNEELEEWTPRQEKQFQKALGPLLGLPPKERWRLVAEKVEGKDHKECASHYKLQQILERLDLHV